MGWSERQVADRLEIQDAVTRYSHGLDQRLWEQWDLAFTPDAIIDYRPVGLGEFTLAEARNYFTAGDPQRYTGQHLVANTLIDLAGDTAKARSEYTFFTFARTDDPAKALRTSGGGWYDDDLIRTDVGWRMTRRTMGLKWVVTDTIDWHLPG